MKRFLLSLVAGAALIGALLVVTRFSAPKEEVVAELEVARPRLDGSEDLPALAQHVRYSDVFSFDRASRVKVHVSGRGSVIVSLVDGPGERVRELYLEGPAEGAFSSVAPGEWSLRAVAPPGAGDGSVVVRAVAGGSNRRLLLLTGFLLLLPLLWPYREAPKAVLRRLSNVPPAA